MSDIVELLKSRKSESFEGECHLTNEEADAIIAELSTAYRRGREDMREEAAKAGYVECAKTRHVTLGDAVAAAIRKLEA